MLRGPHRAAVAIAAAGALVAAAPAQAGILLPYSGWRWASPEPHGELVSDVEFAGTTGYAVGFDGAILRSDDAGRSWTELRSRPFSILDRVRVQDGGTVFASGRCSGVRRSDDRGRSFRLLAGARRDEGCLGAGIAPLRSDTVSFWFVGGAVGYVLDRGGRVRRTLDGGRTFSRRASLPEPALGLDPIDEHPVDAGDIFFSDARTGLATAGSSIFRTADAARSWRRVVDAPGHISQLHFPSRLDGYALGGGLLRTANGGRTWFPAALAGADGAELHEIDCFTPSTCLIATSRGVMRTGDGGATVTLVLPGGWRMAAAGAQRAAAIRRDGAVATSDDGGVSFTVAGGALAGAYRRLRTTDARRVYVGGTRGRIAASLDAGRTWSLLQTPLRSSVTDLAFPTQQTGFALDRRGGLQRTDDGGASWRVVQPQGPPRKIAGLRALDSRRLLLIGGPTGVRRSLDGGRSFRVVLSPAVRGRRLFDSDQVGRTVIAWGERTIVRSRDGGRSWRRMPLPSRTRLFKLDFASQRVGFALDGFGRVFRTRDSARHWSLLRSPAAYAVYDMSFADARHGFLLAEVPDGPPGHIAVLRTDNGGRTWRPQLLDDADLLIEGFYLEDGTPDPRRGARGLAVAAIGPRRGVALVKPRQLFFTSTRGDRGRRTAISLRAGRLPGGAVRLTGRLRGGRPGDQVTVLRDEGNGFVGRQVRARRGGRFRLRLRARRRAVIVARFMGDGARRGAGSRLVRVPPED
jgi:photosystem II stability/assembly factor-like uncharacterized protein